MSNFLSKFDELTTTSSGFSLSRFKALDISKQFSQQLVKNKKILLILLTAVSLVSILIQTNQHEVILASLPSINISTKGQTTSEIPESGLFAKFQPPPVLEGQNLADSLFKSDDSPPKFALSDADINHFLALPLSQRFDLYFPYKTELGMIDKNIFQQQRTTKLEDLGRDITRYINSFKVANEEADFKHFLYDDQMIQRFLIREYGLLFPEVIELYHAFPKNILRYDFFRYLILYAYGGTYADTDTEASKPISQWLSYNETIYGDENSIGAVIGPEGECDCQDWEKLEGRRIQFCQWTAQFKRHHPILKFTILNIYKSYYKNYDRINQVFTAWDGKTYDFKQPAKEYLDGVIEFTGPTMFTDSIYEYLNSLDSESFEINSPNDHDEIYRKLRHPHPKLTRHSYVWEHDINKNVGWENFTLIQQPLVINKDIMIVPKFYFNPRKIENSPDDQYWVRHNYHGTWKNSPN